MSKLIVCGLHRSGTTFVGAILKLAGVVVVHEPLNERYGMKDVPIAYPYVSESDGTYSSLLNDALYFSRPWNKNPVYAKLNILHKMKYQLTGGRSGLRWGALRMGSAVNLVPKNVCFKDPFMSLATPSLTQKHQLKVVCLVRHPAAIHYSTEKQGWGFDIENLYRQSDLIEKYGFDISDTQWTLARKHAAASIAILWKLMIRVNIPLAKQGERLLMVSHESLCIKPQETVRRICNHLGIPFSLELEQFVAEHSGGDSAEARNGATHDFKRDSKAIVNIWRGRLNNRDERMMRDIVSEEVNSFYGHW